MSWTDQNPRIATESDVTGPWSGGKAGEFFKCNLCGYKFKVGDYWRWVHMTEHHLTNILVCQKCDANPNLTPLKWVLANQDWERMRTEGPFWYFIVNLERGIEDLERSLRGEDENRIPLVGPRLQEVKSED